MVIKLTWSIIKFSSVTYAIQAQNILKKYNIKSTLEHSSHKKSPKGCGYLLRVSADKDNIKKILNNHKIIFLND